MEIINSTPQSVVKFTWEVRDNEYTYMDTWEMGQAEWDALTPEAIERRQQEQYAQWRAYMNNPGA